MPVRRDSRETPQEFTEQRHNVQPPEHRAHADLQGTGRLPFGTGQVSNRILDDLETACHLLQKSLASLRQSQATRTTLEQPHAHPGLKAGNIFAYGSRCQAQASRSLGETPRLGAADETLDTAETFHRLTRYIWFTPSIAITVYTAGNRRSILAPSARHTALDIRSISLCRPKQTSLAK
ncbi:hypothetical protein D3C76_1047270 [compost metagenome]